VVFLLAARLLPAGTITSVILMLIVLAGGIIAAFLPGFFAISRTVQGIATAAAIGLWGTIVFMAIDIILLRPFKAFPWTWDAIGGGSTWWYLPIWWMLGTFLAWMGAMVTAGRAARGRDASVRSLAIPAVIGGLGVGLALGIGGLMLMPVAAGLGFAATLVLFALIGIARRG
ncbi:MAG TPA: hypothetical protein VE714_07645, partial [Gemmatimonadales bacterium]|nr:hypothetical protein [Gemmatimonadales bacterium]